METLIIQLVKLILSTFKNVVNNWVDLTNDLIKKKTPEVIGGVSCRDTLDR